MLDGVAHGAGAAIGISRAPSHVLVDPSRARAELGYRDLMPVREGLRETVDWYVANPVTAEAYPWLSDLFDYGAEDMLVAAYRRAIGSLADRQPMLPFVHPYAHPREPDHRRDHRAR